MSNAIAVMTELARRVEALPDWHVRDSGRTYVCRSPGGQIVTLSKSAGDSRTHANAMSRLKKAGFFDDEKQQQASDKDQAKERTESGRKDAETRAEKLAANAKKAVPAKKAAPEPAPATDPFSLQSVVSKVIGAPTAPVPDAPPAGTNGNGHGHVPAAAGTAPEDADELVTRLGEDVVYEGGDMYTRTEWITYEHALELATRPAPLLSTGQELEQRKLSESFVLWLASIMRRHLTSSPGAWTLTHQGLAVPFDQPDAEGRLIPRSPVDGQHRVRAVIAVAEKGGTIDNPDGTTTFVPPMPGVKIPMRVTYNCDPDMFKDLDHGLNRTFGHTLQSMGYDKLLVGANSNDLSSAAKLWYGVRGHYAAEKDDEGMPTGPFANPAYFDRMKPTDEQLTGIIADKNLLLPHMAIGKKTAQGINAKGSRGIPAAFVVFRVLAFRACPALIDRLNEFCDAVRTGANLPEGNPAKTLREWMMGGCGTSPGPRRVKQLAGLLYAWNRYVPGDELKKMMVDVNGKPLPRPVSPAKRRLPTKATSA